MLVMRTDRSFTKLFIVITYALGIYSIMFKRKLPLLHYKNFVSKQVSLQLTKEYLSGLVDACIRTNPEVLEIKPLISN